MSDPRIAADPLAFAQGISQRLQGLTATMEPTLQQHLQEGFTRQEALQLTQEQLNRCAELIEDIKILRERLKVQAACLLATETPQLSAALQAGIRQVVLNPLPPDGNRPAHTLLPPCSRQPI